MGVTTEVRWRAFTIGAVFLLYVLSAGAADVLDLAGTWSFALDPADTGVRERWFGRDLPDSIDLPGSVQEQGYGDPPATNSPWVGTIPMDEWARPLYAPYREPDNFKMPFWLQPDRVYAGAAWFQRQVTVPDTWAGRHMILALERAHWGTMVWVDDQPAGSCDSLAAAHIYDLDAFLTPGPHRLTLRVDNRLLRDVGVDANSVSDQTQGNWNGIAGNIRLCAEPATWIDELQIHPDAARRRARVTVTLGSRDTEPAEWDLVLRVHSQGATPAVDVPECRQRIALAPGTATNVTVDYAFGESLLPWDEFDPNLYELEVALEKGAKGRPARGAVRTAVLGFRSVRATGAQLTIDGRRLFLRGTAESCVFPQTGYPPTDVAAWARIIATCKAYGLNHMRFHSWCPPDAAFTAADELGFYLAVECGAAGRVGDGNPVDAWLHEEARRITRDYGNHPSFMLMAGGHELGGGRAAGYLSQWCDLWCAQDPRRLYTGAAGGPSDPVGDFRILPVSTGAADLPATAWDHGDLVAKQADKPLIGHGLGRWCAYPDFATLPKYTGSRKARHLEVLRDLLQAQGMDTQARDFVMASGMLQLLCYKADIEAALRTPGYGGFQLFALPDFPGQGAMSVGVVDPFWHAKPYVTAAQFRRFCGPTVPLARMARRVWTTQEVFRASVEVAHFGNAPLPPLAARWRVTARREGTVAEGVFPTGIVLVGSGRRLGDIAVDCATLRAPAKYTLEVALPGTDVANDWDFWVYPDAVEDPELARHLVITHTLDRAARDALEKGGRVLILPGRGDLNHGETVNVGPCVPVPARTAAREPRTLGFLCDPQHPAFRHFPTDAYANWQWWDLFPGAPVMVLNELPPAVRPVVQPIDDWARVWRLGLLIEAQVGKGRLMVCSMDVSGDLANRPVARQLRHSLVSYMCSKRFEPKPSLTLAELQTIFRNTEPPADAPAPGGGAQAVAEPAAPGGS